MLRIAGQLRATEFSQRQLSLLMSAFLLLAGWGALYVTCTPYTVEGTISDLREDPRLRSTDRFHLIVRLSSGGFVRVPSLHGECGSTQKLPGTCLKPEFPIKAPIKLTIHGFVDPAACPDIGRIKTNRDCAIDMIGLRSTYVGAIEVGGQPVRTGWAPHWNIVFPFGVLAAISWLLAWHNWQWTNIRPLTFLIFLHLVCTCFSATAMRYLF